MVTENQEKAAKLLYLVWKHIDKSSMSSSRLMGIWDEFLGKVKMAAYSQDPAQFLEVLCRRMGITALKTAEIVPLLEEDIIREIRENTRLVILLTRGIVEENKKQYILRKEKKEQRELTQRLLTEANEEFNEFLKEVKEGEGE